MFFLFVKGKAKLCGQTVYKPKPGIMPGVFIFFAWVAQTNY
jgi:hypothetical protein